MTAPLRVVRKRKEADDTWSFLLQPLEGEPVPASAGAHISLRLPSGNVRQYSLCNTDDTGRAYEICVLRTPASRGGSIELCDRVQEGDLLWAEAPVNRFPLVEHAGPAILMAGGIGLTPLLAMARELSVKGRDFKLNYFARSANAAAFAHALRERPFVGRVEFFFGSDIAVQQQAIEDCLRDRPASAHVYVCGPTGFIDYVLETAGSLGWPSDALHWERFTAVTSAPPGGDAAFDVIVRSTGARIHVPAGTTALEALERGGISIPRSCEQGICGTCLTGVVEGEVIHNDSYLTPEERARNDQFLPCCSRAKSQFLVLDL